METQKENATPANVDWIKVLHTNGTSSFGRRNLDDKLSTLRIELVEENFMIATDVFLFDNAAFNIKDESVITLGQFFKMQPKTDDKAIKVLKVDTSVKPFKDVVNYSRLDKTQKLAFLTTEISSIYVCNGLCIRTNSAGKVEFGRTFQNLYRFKEGYLPQEIKPALDSDFESFLTFSEVTNSMQTSGVNKTSVSLSTPWASGESSYEQAKKNSKSSGKVRSFFTERHVCNKMNLSINPEKIIPDYEFVKELKTAVMNKKSGLDKCCALVKLLNEWGWYVPLQITLGGALYATDIKETDTYKETKEESTKFSVSFKGEFKGIGGGASHEAENTSGSENTNTHKREQMIFYQIGGSGLGKNNIAGWVDSLNDATTWNIISFEKLYPTLRIVGDNEPEILSECLRVLKANYSNKYVKELQKFIDVANYEFEITKAVSATWD